MEKTRETLEYRTLQGNLPQEAADWKYIATKQQQLLNDIQKKLEVMQTHYALSEEDDDTLFEMCQDIDSMIHIKNFLP